MNRIERWSAVVAAVMLTGAALAGCTSTDTPSETTTGDVPAEVTAAVEAAYDGNDGDVPVDGPPAAEGKDVWIISAFQQVSGLAYLSSEAQAAAAAIGWDSTVCDGQNNANGAWASCVRQAVAANADAIILESVDCAPVRAALLEARDAGVLVAATTAFDCDDPSQGSAEPLLDAKITYTDGVDGTSDYYEQMGKLRAQWVVAQSGGAAKVLHVEFKGVAFGDYLSKGFTDELAKCGACEIVGTLSITPADIPQIRQKFDTAYLQASDADVVVVDVDFMFAVGIQQSLIEAGRTDVQVAGGECAIESVGYIRTGGGQQMCIGSSLGRISWSVIDQLNRVFAGQELAKDGVGWQLVDAEHNLPGQGEQYDGAIDYRKAYETSWAAVG